MAEQRPYRSPGAVPLRLRQVKALTAVCLMTSFIAINWVTTQHTARAMGYSPRLGYPLLHLPWVGPLYCPWDWMVWAWHWKWVERMRPLWLLSMREVLYPTGIITAAAVGAIA